MALLNLASRPARNEILPTLAFSVAITALAALTVEHALLLRSLLPDRTSKLHAEARDLGAEAAALRSEAAVLRGPAPDPATVARWGQLKELVDRRTFSWTQLLSRLEAVIPEGVRITSIAPRVEKEKEKIRLDLTAQTQSQQGSFDLLKRLQELGSFRNVQPVSVTEAGREGNVKEYRYTMDYDPDATERAPVESSPPPPDEGESGPTDQGVS